MKINQGLVVIIVGPKMHSTITADFRRNERCYVRQSKSQSPRSNKQIGCSFRKYFPPLFKAIRFMKINWGLALIIVGTLDSLRALGATGYARCLKA